LSWVEFGCCIGLSRNTDFSAAVRLEHISQDLDPTVVLITSGY